MDGNRRYSVHNLQAMIRHGREKHTGGTLAMTKYQASKVQVLFLGIGHIYFKVNPDLTASLDINMHNYLCVVFLQGGGFNEVMAVDSSQDHPLLLNITCWNRFMPEIQENVDQCRAVHALKGKHVVDKQDGIFNVLQRTVLGHHKTTWKKLEHSANPFLLTLQHSRSYFRQRSATVVQARYWWNHGLPTRLKWYFMMQSNDDNNYIRLFVQMVRALIQVRQGHPCKLIFEYTEHQVMQLSVLIECLKGAVQWLEAS